MSTSTNPRIVYISHEHGHVAVSAEFAQSLAEEAYHDSCCVVSPRPYLVSRVPAGGVVPGAVSASAGPDRVQVRLTAALRNVIRNTVWLLVTLAIIAVMCSIGPTLDQEQGNPEQWHGSRLAQREVGK